MDLLFLKWYHGHSRSDPGSTYQTLDEISGVRQERDPFERIRRLILAHDIAIEQNSRAWDAIAFHTIGGRRGLSILKVMSNTLVDSVVNVVIDKVSSKDEELIEADVLEAIDREGKFGPNPATYWSTYIEQEDGGKVPLLGKMTGKIHRLWTSEDPRSYWTIHKI